MMYDPDEDKDIYKKESLRRLRAELYRTPVEAPRKVAILQLAERIPAEGQNLLLKIIEEPPEDTFFVFTAQNRYRLLPTVLSRVTCYTLPPAAPADCLRRMKELAPGHTEEELNRALLRCGGSPETGAALLRDPAAQKRYAAAEEMLAGLAMANPYRAIAAAAPMEKDRRATPPCWKHWRSCWRIPRCGRCITCRAGRPPAAGRRSRRFCRCASGTPTCRW